jgi:hypothetical protein
MTQSGSIAGRSTHWPGFFLPLRLADSRCFGDAFSSRFITSSKSIGGVPGSGDGSFSFGFFGRLVAAIAKHLRSRERGKRFVPAPTCPVIRSRGLLRRRPMTEVRHARYSVVQKRRWAGQKCCSGSTLFEPVRDQHHNGGLPFNSTLVLVLDEVEKIRALPPCDTTGVRAALKAQPPSRGVMQVGIISRGWSGAGHV